MKYLDMVKLPSLNSASTTTKLMNKSTGRRLDRIDHFWLCCSLMSKKYEKNALEKK